jgi:hypothetical protein
MTSSWYPPTAILILVQAMDHYEFMVLFAWGYLVSVGYILNQMIIHALLGAV